jgi:hypothetical protein
MSTFTKQFANADEYEEWLLNVGPRINVLSITNPTGKPIYRQRTLWMKGASNPTDAAPNTSGQQASSEITVKYQTSDRSLAPAKSTTTTMAEVAIVVAIFFGMFVFAIMKF